MRKDFLDFQLESSVASQIGQLGLFYSADDVVEGVANSVKTLQLLFQRRTAWFADKGHFTRADMGEI